MEFDLKLDDHDLRGIVPGSYAARDDILSAAITNWRRASCAALGLCLRGLKPEIKPRLALCGYSPLDYGGRVLDHLMERGFSRSGIIAAGMICWNEIAESMPTEAEVKEKEDFLDPAAER